MKFRKPMLAKDYDDHKDKVVYPCYAQPKVDGVRCVTNGQSFWSRAGNMFPRQNFRHLQIGAGQYLVDGELSLVDGHASFEEIVSIVKRADHPDSGRLCFNAFDIMTDHAYGLRRSILKEFFRQNQLRVTSPQWFRLKTRLVSTPRELQACHDFFILQGYEGTMVRSAFGKYVSKRTTDLLKWKPLKDAEFEIIDVLEAKGKDKGTPVFVCWAGDDRNGAAFRARPKGDMERRRAMWRDRKKLVGKMLTVEYQNMTRYGVPRFPRAKVLRDYE